MSRTKTLERPNEGKHIHDIVDRTICLKHHAALGEPCFKIYYDSFINTHDGEDIFGFAICGARVHTAGFRGKITPTSLSRSDKPKSTKYSPQSSEKDFS
jgi:hypothetical protein